MIQKDPQASQPFQTFTDNGAAFHLNRDPSFKQMSIDQVAEKYRLPDLRPALVDFIHRYMPSNSAPYLIGGRRSTVAHSDIGSMKIRVWSGVRLQTKSFHNVDEVIPSKLANACPPCEDWPLELYDSVIINTDRSKIWPQSGLAGERDFASFDK